MCVVAGKFWARILSQAQDTRLTWAKFKCTTFSSCDDLNTMDKQWVYSIGINNVVVELRKHYPNATHQQLMQVAQMYAAEADSSYNQGTTRFITGALNDSPAFGLAASGLKTTVKGGIHTFLTDPMYGSKAAQLGTIGSEFSFIKNIITSQKIAPDLMIKGVHFNIGRIELKALPNHEGGIIFKPVFSYSNPNEVAKAIAQANQALKDERFRTFLIKHAEAGIQMSKQTNNPKILEFQFLKDALQRSSNENIKHKNR
ncbi:hypothetical protein QEO94_00740 [Kingella negevensis]|uniref:hypothetical protein n=1 Tax=Kingella negevensis TaxID=1522312 RepID=UPI002543D8C6|nr:hypothetical protein [Kingella negevensis]WII93418.1 hypothetical protein QEO94_00740 [Kingella negevensis]